MTNAAKAAERLVAAADSGELDDVCQTRGVRLLGLFGSTVRPAGGPPPNDVDVAASWDGLPDELGLLDDLVVVTGFDAIDLAVIDRADPLLRANALVGKPLFESESGLYAVTQMAALAEERDTRWLRALGVEALRTVIPPTPDRATVAARLRAMSETLGDLEALRSIRDDTLREEPLTRAAAERLIQVVVDLAVDINTHLVTSATGAAPHTGHDSFTAMAGIGALTDDLANRLAPCAGLRNILVHRYADIRTDLVADAIPTVLDGFAEFVTQVADWLTQPG
ncbi:MAG TPA: DUF86 domain-containing protein [Acidimicrobiales bacterium]|nr:DUF86 domain-containing protein [Acidimicrobiales bacterium]